jgi:hypothetical protein
MNRRTSTLGKFAVSAMLASAAAFVTAPILATPSIAAEKPVAAEKNPPGDIPDTQVFITYKAKSGYSLNVPEGWARSDRMDGVSFVDKLDGVLVTETIETSPPDATSVKAGLIPELGKRYRALRLGKVDTTELPAGHAIRISFSSNSEPNAVTNKQVRLENEVYLYHKGDKTVRVQFYAPYGADNVDQWQLMSRSFRWN